MASRPAPTGTGISTASALITAPAANPGPLGPAQARASRPQVYACAAAASNSGMHVPRARGAGDQERPAPLPKCDPAGFCGQCGSAARTTTASQGPYFYTARQPPWRPRHLTGTSVLREALKFTGTAYWDAPYNGPVFRFGRLPLTVIVAWITNQGYDPSPRLFTPNARWSYALFRQ